MNIPEKLEQIKVWINTKSGRSLVIIMILVISNIASFNLGQESITQNKENVKIQPNDTVQDYSLADPELPKTGSLAAAIMAQNDTNREEGMIMNQGLNNETTSPRYVASKKGRVYYFTWCSGAKNILIENKIYFNSAQEARATGLTPSKTCPDLD